MNKYLLLILMLFGLISCQSAEQYYLSSPKKIQEALRACPNKQPKGLSCDEMKQLALTVNQLSYELQSNQQEFGKKIMALQNTIRHQESELEASGSHNETLEKSLMQNKRDLTYHLAVVKWFESPSERK